MAVEHYCRIILLDLQDDCDSQMSKISGFGGYNSHRTSVLDPLKHHEADGFMQEDSKELLITHGQIRII